jgi:hypothetical protein
LGVFAFTAHNPHPSASTTEFVSLTASM